MSGAIPMLPKRRYRVYYVLHESHGTCEYPGQPASETYAEVDAYTELGARALIMERPECFLVTQLELME